MSRPGDDAECSWPLSGLTIVDLSAGISGAYCTKMLVDAGAHVIRVEPPEGDPLRRRRTRITTKRPGDAELFQFLAASKSSFAVDPTNEGDLAALHELIIGADAVIWSPNGPLDGVSGYDPAALRSACPGAVLLTITDFGLDGPWTGKPANDFTRQAWSGGILDRGSPGREPLCVGGQVGDWVSGAAAAATVLSALRRARRTGIGEAVDFSMLEAHVLFNRMAPVTTKSIWGRPQVSPRRGNVPSIERTKDGWVGFCLVRGQQWLDFCAMLGRPDWADQPDLLLLAGRWKRQDELLPLISDWMTERTTNEIVELATLFRIPVTEVGNGALTPKFEQFESPQYFQRSAGEFLHPSVPYRLAGSASTRPIGHPPTVGQDTHTLTKPSAKTIPSPVLDAKLPFEGLRIVDLSHFWAGPIVGAYLAAMGADVIKVESIQRPDGMRFNTPGKFEGENWWERGAFYHVPNVNKRDITLNLDDERGREILRSLVDTSDALLENFTPRVCDQWGLKYENLSRNNPALIMMRLPAFGLTGPWSERPGYGPTMEQVSGMTWVTGYPDGPPEIPNGMMDPISGFHALVAFQAALAHRDRTGEGMLVEVPMVSAALNICAEQVIEFSAHRELLVRNGNRSRFAAPQGVYLTADEAADGTRDCWVAISVETDQQWRALCDGVGNPEWANGTDLATHEGRTAAHDDLDKQLTQWCGTRTGDEIISALWEAGVPVAKVMDPYDHDLLEPLRWREFFTNVDHPVTGRSVHGRFPALFSAGPSQWVHRRVPMLGEHNSEVLQDLLGLSDSDLAELEEQAIIGTRPIF